MILQIRPMLFSVKKNKKVNLQSPPISLKIIRCKYLHIEEITQFIVIFGVCKSFINNKYLRLRHVFTRVN